ncbi:MAG: UDP-4-amino-4-deoxy-L-arabinose--oxoglutarate aminotransferase, partial [Deltaproteobacteria bacterium]
MTTEFLPFSKPDISEQEIAAVTDILRSGWITTGRQCADFETEFSSYCQNRQEIHSVALSSATAGMHLLLQALDIGEGDEVITPSLTWVSTVNLIVLAGATPVFADIDRESLMVTRETVAPCISRRTRLILPVHFAGAALDLTPLRQLAAEYNIALVEDAAHAVGTEYYGEKIGSSG